MKDSDGDVDRQRKSLAAVPRTKICRICLLARENTPSPVLGFVKKDADKTWMDRLKIKMEDTKLLFLEFFGQDIVETPDDRRLIAPCDCKGTMKYVHRGCLNVWRLNSTRKDSYYKCEQCFTKYCFKETTFSMILSSQKLIRVLTGLAFFSWIYGWFLFVGLTQNLTGQIDEAGLFVDYADLRSMGYHRGFYAATAKHHLRIPTLTTDEATFNWSTTTTTTTAPLSSHEDIFSSEECKQKTPTEIRMSLLIPSYVQSFFKEYLFELAYTIIIVALFDFLITNPSVILAVNMVYLIWRCIKYGGSFELAWLSACASFGLARTLRSIHLTISGLVQRYIKLRCIEIVDRDDDPIIAVKCERLKAETHLY
jgi:hypothetical protein